MNKSKLTLLIDGNWLLMSRLVVIANKYNDDFELCHNLQLLMIQSIKLVLKKFPDIDNIIFCSDGGSWRNGLPIPEFLKDENGNPITYKGNREKAEDINWDMIFTSYEELIEMLKQQGINAYKEHNVEGDDLIWWWSTYLNKNNTNCIIWSKDNDLKQLINIDHNKCFTVWWNKENGMYTSKFNDNDLDFLFNNDFNENDRLFSNITKNIEVTQEDKNHIIIDKIIRGDLGDNIEPIIYKQTPKSTRKYRVSQSDINYSMNWKDDTVVYNFLKNLLSTKKYSKNINKTLDEAFKHFKYNRTLVALDIDSYPKDIINILEDLDYTYSGNVDSIYIVESNLRATINNINGILDLI